MNSEIDQLAQALYITIGVSVIVVSSILIYLCWLWLQIHRDVKRLLRPPAVPRNGQGRRLYERE
jgi:cell division protein FtsL